MWQKALAEMVGAFILVLAGAGVVIAMHYPIPPTSTTEALTLLTIAFANGLGLAVAVSIAMNTSGGHINPAITLGFLATGRIKAATAAVYIGSQVLGATIAALILWAALPSTITLTTHLGAPQLSSSITIMQGILIEAAITFVLATAVFGTAVDRRAPKMGGLMIGLALAAGIMMAGPFTGGAANPARALGPEIVSMNFTNWYVWWIGPVLGAVIAALVYDNLILGRKK